MTTDQTTRAREIAAGHGRSPYSIKVIAAGLDAAQRIALENVSGKTRARNRFVRTTHPATAIRLYVYGLLDTAANLTPLGRAVAAVLAEETDR
jgi:hypothetical protein